LPSPGPSGMVPASLVCEIGGPRPGQAALNEMRSLRVILHLEKTASSTRHDFSNNGETIIDCQNLLAN
jgi:hypothetical protein